MVQPLQIFLIIFEQIEREADEIVKVHRAAIGKRALVIGINRQPHLC